MIASLKAMFEAATALKCTCESLRQKMVSVIQAEGRYIQ